MSKMPDVSELTRAQREALLELGIRGPGGSFDQVALGELFVMGFVEVRNSRVLLTDQGRLAFSALAKGV